MVSHWMTAVEDMVTGKFLKHLKTFVGVVSSLPWVKEAYSFMACNLNMLIKQHLFFLKIVADLCTVS